LAEYVKGHSDEKEQADARNDLLSQLQKSIASIKPPSQPTRGNGPHFHHVQRPFRHVQGAPFNNHGPQSYQGSSGPNTDSANPNGDVLVITNATPTLFNTSSWASGGVAALFTPPFGAVYTFQPSILYNFEWGVQEGLFGGGGSSGTFQIFVFAYLNGQHLRSDRRFPALHHPHQILITMQRLQLRS
jgi:hypothetical protein